jgi:hypothetical protein
MVLMSSLTRYLLAALTLYTSLFLIACGGRAINKKTAREVIADSPMAVFAKEDVYIESVSQTGQRDALVEARLKAAFRFEKVQGKWVIREVRLGDRPWEKLDDILAALQTVKTEETRNLLEKVAVAIVQYRQKKGSLPPFKDYISLSNQLNPEFLIPLIRLDAWQRPLAASMVGTDTVRLESAGADGKFGTEDDIVKQAGPYLQNPNLPPR